MTNVFAVVGQHRAEPGRLLLRGDDGRYYAYATNGHLSAVEPSNAWVLDGADDRAPETPPSGPETAGTGRRSSAAAGGRRRARRSWTGPIALLALALALLAAPAALAHAPALATATTEAPLRAAPDVAATVLAIVPAGETVELTGAASGDFLEVAAGGVLGWTDAALLDGGLATATAVVETVLRLGPSPDGEPARIVPAESTVILTGAASDGFLAASYDGSGGWIAAEALA